MAFGLASYVGVVETINLAEPLSLFYVVRITGLTSGSISFDLPAEASISDVIPYVGPSPRSTDRYISMGGADNSKGKISAITIVGRRVTVTAEVQSYGVGQIQVGFFNAKGVRCSVSN